MIHLTQVSKYYGGHTAADSISFTVQEGETFVLLGTSGCGKTTTLRMINRLTTPDKGEITVNGRSVLNTPVTELRKGIGYVMQQNGLFPHYTIEENISTVPALLGWDTQRTRERARSLMEKLHLPPESFADKYPHQLSGGQQQRVGLARALAADPPILLMDEPFGALDPVTRQKVRGDFAELEEIGHKTIVLVTHDIQEAFEMGDRICLMNQGRIEQTGTPAELLFKPASDFVKAFFDTRRTLLELTVATIKDIWPWLPEQPVISEQHPLLPAATTCWQLLEWLTQHEQPALAQHNQQVKTIGRQNLMDAFSNFKSSQFYRS